MATARSRRSTFMEHSAWVRPTRAERARVNRSSPVDGTKAAGGTASEAAGRRNLGTGYLCLSAYASHRPEKRPHQRAADSGISTGRPVTRAPAWGPASLRPVVERYGWKDSFSRFET